jgi:hypothetical protein
MKVTFNMTHLTLAPVLVWPAEANSAFALDKYRLAVNWTGKLANP